jgi:hypothetical protein
MPIRVAAVLLGGSKLNSARIYFPIRSRRLRLLDSQSTTRLRALSVNAPVPRTDRVRPMRRYVRLG